MMNLESFDRIVEKSRKVLLWAWIAQELIPVRVMRPAMF